MPEQDTIVALASGALPSAIAIVRISGTSCRDVVSACLNRPLQSNCLSLRRIISPYTGELMDEAMTVFMPGPNSFTGEDCAEFHLHGSPAIVREVIAMLTRHPGVRLALPGEFSRRAFEAGKLDLMQVEGLSDLILSETETQRKQALNRLKGGLSNQVSKWRDRIVSLLAEIEAHLDFSDEGDVGGSDWPEFSEKLRDIQEDIEHVLSGYDRGQIVREGFRIGLAGPPNAGKSSILNYLAGSDIAIVTSEAGTTRDIKEVSIEIGGQLVVFSDSAGLRATENPVEAEGIRRALAMLRRMDLILWVTSVDTETDTTIPGTDAEILYLCNKSDLGVVENCTLAVSCKSEDGFPQLLKELETRVSLTSTSSEGVLISHLRDKESLEQATFLLKQARMLLDSGDPEPQLELVAESILRATHQMQRLLGLVDCEDVLDQLFSGFCIGK